MTQRQYDPWNGTGMELEREQRKLLVLRERARRAEQAWRATPHARRSARLRAEMRWRLAADDRERQRDHPAGKAPGRDTLR